MAYRLQAGRPYEVSVASNAMHVIVLSVFSFDGYLMLVIVGDKTQQQVLASSSREQKFSNSDMHWNSQIWTRERSDFL